MDGREGDAVEDRIGKETHGEEREITTEPSLDRTSAGYSKIFPR